jgi:parvulin-like peptidyl-prolyl isomerase
MYRPLDRNISAQSAGNVQPSFNCTLFTKLMPPVVILLSSLLLATGPVAGESGKTSEPIQRDQPTQRPASAESATGPDRVVAARVGRAEVTVEDLIKFATLNPQRVRTLAAGPEGRAEVLRLLIANVLLQQAMAEAGVLPAEGSDPAEFQEAYQQLRKQRFGAPESIPEPDLRAYYEKNAHLFGIPAAARISQIQLRFPADADEQAKAETKERALAALQRLESGEDFSTVAAEVTENEPARESKGDLGFIEYGSWSEWLSQALDGVEAGERTGVLPSPFGYEILKVTETRDAITAPFDLVRDTVEQRMRQEREMEIRDAFVKQLAEKTEIVIELEELRQFFQNGVFPSVSGQ